MSEEAALRDLAANRSRAYWFVAEIFAAPPDPAFLDGLRRRLVSGAASVAGFAEMRAALDDADVGALAERLAREHLRLFGGLDEATGLPPPYESVHREGRLMGGTTEAVLAAYAEAGLGDPEPAVAPGDHIAAELKFMALLCHEEMAAHERDDGEAAEATWRRQHRFLHRHLLAWAPEYCRRLAREAQEPYYAGCAAVAEQVLADDKAALDDLVGALGLA